MKIKKFSRLLLVFMSMQFLLYTPPVYCSSNSASNAPNRRLERVLDRCFTGHEHLDCFKIINMNGRLYEPVTVRFFSPDPYVANGGFTQDFNRFAYIRNNPLMYTDPSGEFWHLIIGAVIGGVSDGMIGHAHGATGWNMVGYIAGGATIGAVSGLSGGAVASGIGQSLQWAGAGGAVGGAISGGGFAALSGGNVLDGMWKRAVSGLAGGLVGSYIGGGWGAFAGGATSGVVGSALNGGDILKSALIGCTISWGSYRIQQEVAFRQYKNGNKPFGDLTRSGFNKLSVASQRSFGRGKEAGGWILDNGDVGEIAYGRKEAVSLLTKPSNAIANFHTHPNGSNYIQYHSIWDLVEEMDVNYIVARSNIYGHNSNTNPLPSNYASYSQSYIYNTLIPSLITTYNNS